MLKVFLVEDEIVMREGIKNNINWNKEGFEFVGDASDGELAFPMIQQLKPDIVITDIKMPFMDGIELSRLLKKENPKIKIIILSGYNDFNYAKEAITIGVTDYLLKPISSVKLIEAVKEVAQKVEEENKQLNFMECLRAEMLENEHLEKQHLFTDIITNRLSMSEILEKARRLGIELIAPYYNILLFQAKRVETDASTYSEDVIHIGELIEVAFSDNRNMHAFDRGVEGWAFLIKGETEEMLQKHLEEGVAEITRIVTAYENVQYFGGIGDTVQRLRELLNCFDKANRAYSYRYMITANRFLSFSQIDQYKPGSDPDMNLSSLDIGKVDRKVLQNFLKSGLKEEIEHFIEDYFFSIGEANMRSQLFRQYIAMDMYFASVAFMEELGYSSAFITDTCGDLLNVSEVLNSHTQTKAYLLELIKKTVELRDRASAKKYGSLLDDAKEFIHNNYDKDNLSLNTVAASVNISPSHFSTIFSQEVGQTFIEYVTTVRMEKAKELLRCSNMKSTEIGYAVGYKDSHYFSYLFKKTQDCTPKDYRSRGNVTEKNT